jgi:hypothetical protein
MRKPKTKLLLKLATLLREDARNKKGVRFDYGDWGTVRDVDNPMSCGTEACAFGLAALSGAFKRNGLSWDADRNGTLAFRWKGRRMDPVDAAVKLFGLNYKQACYLFMPENMLLDMNGPNPNQGAEAERGVAKKIEKFVKAGCPAEPYLSAVQRWSAEGRELDRITAR